MAKQKFKVKAVANGYYKDKFRYAGNVFWLEEPHHFSSIWMHSLDSNLIDAIEKDAKLKKKHARLFEKKTTKSGVQVIHPTKKAQPQPQDEEEQDPPEEHDEEEIEDDPPIDDSEVPSQSADSDEAL